MISEMLRGASHVVLATLLGDAGRGLLFVGLLASLWLDAPVDLTAIITAAALASSLVLVTSSVVAWRIFSTPTRGSKFPLIRATTTLVSVSGPFYIAALCAFANTQGDVLVGGLALSKYDLAAYAGASKLALVTTLPIAAITLVLAPRIATYWRSGRIEAMEDAVRRTTAVFAAIVLPVCAILVFMHQSIMELLYSPAYARGGTALAILAIASIFVMATGPNGFVLLMTVDGRYVAFATAVTAVIQLAMMLSLATLYGPAGLASASAGGSIVLNILFAIRLKKKIGIRTDIGLTPWRLIRYSKTSVVTEPRT